MRAALILFLLASTAWAYAPVIHTRDEYEALAVGESYWYDNHFHIKTAQPIIAEAKRPAPVIHTYAEYDALPLGKPYWYEKHLYTKTDAPIGSEVAAPTPEGRSTLSATPIPRATPTPWATPASPTGNDAVAASATLVIVLLVVVGLGFHFARPPALPTVKPELVVTTVRPYTPTSTPKPNDNEQEQVEVKRRKAEEERQRLANLEAAKVAAEKAAAEQSWNLLILPDETKAAIKAYCDILSDHDLYSRQGVFIPRGLLFYGPPGCGKTETARVLSKKSGFSFVSLSSADLKVGFIGQAAVAIQNAFREARSKAPSMVYLDELDASCPTRQGGHNSVIDLEVCAQLLQELDGIQTTESKPVFVLASTNRPDLIDPAILERFTERIEIALPNAYERLLLLRNLIGQIPFEAPVGTSKTAILIKLADSTKGKSGRELKNMVTKATMKAVQRSSRDGVRTPVVFQAGDFTV